jgi:hypothetical protein
MSEKPELDLCPVQPYQWAMERKGSIRPKYANTTKGYIKKTKGGPLSRSKGGKNNPNSSPKNNKKNARKRKIANDRRNRDIIEAQGLGYDLRSKEETTAHYVAERPFFSSEKLPPHSP